MKTGRRILAAALVLIAGILAIGAAAGEVAMYAEDFWSGAVKVGWQELNTKKNAKLPVFSAPFEDAWRGAKGKASVSVKEKFSFLGTLQGGTWGLVEYSVDRKSGRIGWIQMPDPVNGNPAANGDLSLWRLALRMTGPASMTDDPRGSGREIRRLSAGERVIGMSRLTTGGRSWIYAETEIGGKTAWGFIPEESVEADQVMHCEGDTLIIHEGVTSLGELSVLADTEDYRAVLYLRPGDLEIRNLALSEAASYEDQPMPPGFTGEIRKIVFPESLRNLGMEALAFGLLDELRLSGKISRISPDALYATKIERMILASDYTGDIDLGQYLRIGAWEVEEGNPRYRAVDGVLFSADRKTLIRYPNARSEENYDVPAGTEVIGSRAFYDDSMGIGLRSISLPIGLRSIEALAFGGCGMLQSMTVPLTVTEIDPTAFHGCVCLERLSLPPGFSAEAGDWATQNDFTWFNGDNGSTGSAPKEKEPWEDPNDFRVYEAHLDREEGTGMIPVYPGPETDGASEELPAGTQVSVYEIRNGRARISGSWEDSVRWVNLPNILNRPGDVFFTVTDAEIRDPDRYNPQGLRISFGWLSREGAEFLTASNDWSTTVPYEDVTLLGEFSPGGLRAGLIPARDPAVMLYDAPEGKAGMRLYFGTQARVTETGDGWLKVETGLGEGWIRENELIDVKPGKE